MEQQDLDQLTKNVRFLPRDVRLAALQGILACDSIQLKLENEENPHLCSVLEAVAIVADQLGFYEEAKEQGLTPLNNN